MSQILGMLPQIGPFKDLQKESIDEKEVGRIEAIINSMTSRERDNPNILNGSRRKRIARGSGTSVQEVNQVLKQYLQMRQMMKQYGALAAQGRLKGLGKLSGVS
jgi:signal recognition particle subunit SRP54